jgi:hypothetical protein
VARHINPKCLHCATLSAEQAIALHGEQGDGCWNPKTCHRRRSHYRYRKDSNTKRRQSTPTLTLGEAAYAAYVYYYKDKPKDAPLHAIAVTVWKGDEKLEDAILEHCGGKDARQIHKQLVQVLATLNQSYGIQKFETTVELRPGECPIRPCPLQGR